MTNDTVNMRLKILNEKGLHARAAAKFVELVDTFDVSLVVKKDDLEASGDSIMGLLMLAASRGTEIELVASGLEAAETLSALSDLIENLFGEEM
jgi:phosphocarrier protein